MGERVGGGGNYEEKSAGVNLLFFFFLTWLLSHNEFSVSIERILFESCS